MHVDTEWVKVKRSKVLDNRKRHMEQSELTFRAGSEISHSKFAFSCLPYTSEELENATHQEELPPARRTVLCIYGAVRGAEESTAGDRMWKRSTGFRETGI